MLFQSSGEHHSGLVNVASLQLGKEISITHFEVAAALNSRAGTIFSASASNRGSPCSGASSGSTPFDSFGRDLESPRQNQRHRETENQEKNNKAHRPVRNFEKWKNLRRDLHEQPTDDCIRDRHFVNVAPFQFGEETRWFHFFKFAAFSFGANEATMLSKRGSPRSGSQKGSSFKAP